MIDSPQPESTRDRILDAAEALFAEQGFDATSIRAITAAAGANLASVNYHFQTKEALIRAVLTRRLDPVNRVRLRLLDQAVAAANPPSLDAILEAFSRPIFEAAFGTAATPAFARVAGRITSEPGDTLRAAALEHLRPVAHRFFQGFALALPHLARHELLWRVHLSIGAMFHILAANDFICEISDGMFAAPTVETATAQWIAHTRAALLAAPLEAEERTKRSAAQ
ncbi:MAG: TetR/AcrR family transcriptional regulator [Bryobacteraceae bacterium]